MNTGKPLYVTDLVLAALSRVDEASLDELYREIVTDLVIRGAYDTAAKARRAVPRQTVSTAAGDLFRAGKIQRRQDLDDIGWRFSALTKGAATTRKRKPDTYRGFVLERQGPEGDWYALKEGNPVYEAMTRQELVQHIDKHTAVAGQGWVNRRRDRPRAPGGVLVVERGLKDTRRNRRWIALVRLLDREVGGGQDKCESLAWAIINTWESTP